jgi:hypothetical protein
MVSTKYLFEVAEFSCLKSILLACVVSVNVTSALIVARIKQKKNPYAMILRHSGQLLGMITFLGIFAW